MHSKTSDPRVADLVKAGKIRVALGLGSAALALKDPKTGALRGPAVDLAQALAKRMGVQVVPIEYPRPGAIMDGIPTNSWDVTFLVADADRAKVADFSPLYMQTDFTYLVRAGSSIRSVAEVDRPGVRIACGRGDASEHRLRRTLQHAQLTGAENFDVILDLLRKGSIDAEAGPRPVLLEQSARVFGARVLDDGFAAISWAAMVPKGQAGHLAYVSEFIEQAKASGLIQRTIDAFGLQGVQVAPAGNPSSR
jgi:polar amino acid transport system substrate-binding protein